MDGGTIWLHDEDPHVSRIISTLSAAGIVTFTPLIAAMTGVQAYTIFGKVHNRSTLRDAVNRALQNIGEFAEYDEFSSTGLQEDYDIATLLPNANRIMSVEISAYSDPSTADNPAWMMHYGWTQFGNTLRFLTDPPIYDGTENIRIGWNIPHPALTGDASEIRREVSPLRLKWEAVAEAYMHLIGPRDSEKLDEQTQNLYNRASKTAGRYPAHGNQPLPEPQLFMGVGSRGGAAINPDLQV
ncbi:hypothetical protein LCGC14_0490890 [marine sediment metagenome]|uniref:Uncharacterized protein n=1 Tax=marine sediment metagenome TaxID=412755 RepID=A0A0F9UTG0_9ZZZZ